MYNEISDLITIDELCDVLSIGRNAAYKLLNNKTIPAFRIGRVWKIPKEGLHAFIRREAGIDVPQPRTW